MLEHSLTCTKRTRNESGSTLYDRIECVDGTHTSFKKLEWTWFFLVVCHSKLNRPVLNHIHFYLAAISLLKHGDSVVNLVLTSLYDALHLSCADELERSHNLKLLRVFLYFSKPSTTTNGVAFLYERLEIP